MFIRHSHWLTIPSSLAPRQNDVICLNLHSRFGLFLSERVLCQSSFAQRDYSQCTYSQTTANGIAGVINELNHSYTITYAAHVSHAGVEIRGDHGGGFVDACQSVALCECCCACSDEECCREDCSDTVVLVHIDVLFCALKGWIVLVGRVDNDLLYSDIVVSPFCFHGLRLSVCGLDVPCTALPLCCCITFYSFFFSLQWLYVIHSPGC